MKKKQITFREWIDRVGMSTLAKRLDVAESTIGHWRNGHCYPRVEQMRVIKKMSRGRVTYDHIIDGVVR